MSKKSNRRRRDTQTIASRRLPLDLLSTPSRHLTTLDQFKGPLRELEDRRQWHPLGPYAPARTIGRRARIQSKNDTRQNRYTKYDPRLRSTAALTFAEPQQVLICARRKIRREVIHAFRKNGRKGQKPARRNFWSRISCKR